MTSASFAALSESHGLRPQKAYAIAFVALALALAGCASGLGASTADRAPAGGVARVEEGEVVSSRMASLASGETSHAYVVRLRTGELASVDHAGPRLMATGAQVLVEYGQSTRLIPQTMSIGY